MELIAQKLSMSIDMFISAYVRAVPTKEAYILQSSADTCPFLRWGEGGARATCSIYLFRPEACRNWIPSLSRPECREGLTKVKAVSELLLPGDIYHSGKEIKRLSSAVKNDSGASS
jgi:Fe-S-cluster containining protein